MRFVLDTNVVVSALVFGGSLKWLQEAIVAGLFDHVVARQTVEELVRVLAYRKLNLPPDRQAKLLAQYLRFATVTTLLEPWPLLPVGCRDRKDEMFIALARQTGATLVSGDADLTSMAGTGDTAIWTAAELGLWLEQATQRD